MQTPQMDPNTKINLTITVSQLNFILQALSQRPFHEVADAINDLRMQATVSLAQANAPKQPEAPNA